MTSRHEPLPPPAATPPSPSDRSARLLVAAGALLAAAGTALAAWAAHADPLSRSGLYIAALFAFGNGIALAALGRQSASRLQRLALAGVLLGTLLFSGALAASGLLGVAARTAPFGGSLMILAWLALAVAALRR